MQGELRGGRRRQDLDLETRGVVVGQIGFHLGDDLGVVRAVFIEPEDGGSERGAGAADGEFDPVLDRGVLRLAGAPDVAGFDGML